MTTFHLQLNPNERLDVERAVQLLKGRFPTTALVGDTFERKRRQLAENLELLAKQGDPIRNPEMLCQVLARKEAEMGPGTDVSITLGDGIKITGSVLSGGINLKSYDSLPIEARIMIENYLRSLDIGRVITTPSSID